MSTLYFLKIPVTIFLFGLFIQFAGALFKVRHWPYADELITFGSLIIGVGILYAIIKIISLKKPD